MPEELINQVDEMVGGRNRSRFVVGAVEEKLRRIKLQRAAEEFVGLISDGEVPEWETKDSTIEWVRALRRDADRLPAGEEAS